MGTWGTNLYENDLALDLKEEYIEKLKKGIENKEALEQIKQEAYKRIEELRKIILNREDEQKEEKLKVLDELKEKIEKYEYQNPFQINWN